jgi:hypothetical protein
MVLFGIGEVPKNKSRITFLATRPSSPETRGFPSPDSSGFGFILFLYDIGRIMSNTWCDSLVFLSLCLLSFLMP